MDSSTATTVTTFMGGATLAQGFSQMITQNATFITTMSIALTALVGFASFIWSKINERKRINIEERRVYAMEESNRISRRNIVEELFIQLDMCSKDCMTKEQIKNKLRKK